jgi:iron complex transport system substrate-binding protein
MLVCAAGLAAGCQESGFDESKETARPLKVQDSLAPLAGTKVPGQAERPMTLTADALGDTLALGVQPVRAALPGARLPEYLRDEAGGVEVVPPLTSQDLLATEAADPDLILGSAELQGGLYPELSRIAPTVMTDGGGGAWKLNVRLHGEALGRTNDAERLLIDYDRRAARAREELGSGAGKTEVSVVLVRPNAILVAGAESFPGKVLSDVGFARPGSQDGTREFETIARDQLPALDGDVMLLSVAPGAEAALARLRQTAAWQGLGAVRSGMVEDVDSGTWWSGGGVLAARAALEDLARLR